MLQLTESEVIVYQQLKLGKTPEEISEALSKSKNHIFHVLTHLVKHGAAHKEGRKPCIYTALDVEYIEKGRYPGSLSQIKKKRRQFKQLKNTMRLIGKDKLRFLLRNYGRMKRKRMAEELGIRKFDLNQICLMLGLGDAA